MTRRAIVLLLVVMTSGCGYSGLDDLPLPGGPKVGDDSYVVTADFKDVLNLTRQTTVKSDGVTIGRVEKITRKGWSAQVRMRLRGDVTVPADVEARIAQTSLLGEKFVDLQGGGAAPARLADGATIPVARTSRGSEVEEVLGALSLLLNGGGVAQLKNISQEMHQALDGETVDTTRFLRQLDTFVGTLDRNRQTIIDTLDNVDRLSAQINADRGTVEKALDEIAPAVTILADQRRELTSMLTHLDEFSRTGTEVIRTAGADLTADLAALEPTLKQLAASGDSLPKALEVILSFPFPDEVLDAVKGDYVNLNVQLDLSALDLVTDVSGLSDATLPKVGSDDPVPQTDALLDSLRLPATPAPSATPAAPAAGLEGLLRMLVGGGS